MTDLFGTEELEVKIKVLTVNGKKLSQALLRQIPQEKLFTDEWLKKGKVWGRLNCFLDGKDTDTLHILWQKGDELRRSFELSRCPASEDSFRISYAGSELERDFKEINSWIKGENEFQNNIYIQYNLHSPKYCEKWDAKNHSKSLELEEKLKVEIQLMPAKIKNLREKSAISFKLWRIAFNELTLLPQLFIAA